MPAAMAACRIVRSAAQSIVWPLLRMVTWNVLVAGAITASRRMPARRGRAHRCELRMKPCHGGKARQGIAIQRQPDGRPVADEHRAVDVVVGHHHAASRLYHDLAHLGDLRTAGFSAVVDAAIE